LKALPMLAFLKKNSQSLKIEKENFSKYMDFQEGRGLG